MIGALGSVFANGIAMAAQWWRSITAIFGQRHRAVPAFWVAMAGSALTLNTIVGELALHESGCFVGGVMCGAVLGLALTRTPRVVCTLITLALLAMVFVVIEGGLDGLESNVTETAGLVGLAGDDPKAQQALLGQLRDGVPLGRVAEPREIANAVLFLASPEASFVNGIELFVDGGSAQI